LLVKAVTAAGLRLHRLEGDRERHQAAAQQQHAHHILRAQMLADQLAGHQGDQQRPQAARDRISVTEIAVGIGFQQERVVRDVHDHRDRQQSVGHPVT